MDDNRPEQPDLATLMAAHATAMADPFFGVTRIREVEATPICQSCALCCQVTGLRTVSPFDVLRLSVFLGMDVKAVRARYVRPDVPSLHSPCGFLVRTSEGYSCGVHPARPDLCREFDRCGVLQAEVQPAELTPELSAELIAVEGRLVLVGMGSEVVNRALP